MNKKTAIHKTTKRSAVIIFMLAVLLFSSSLNIVKAADRSQAANGGRTTCRIREANGDQPPEGKQPADGDQPPEGKQPADGDQPPEGEQPADSGREVHGAAAGNFRNVHAGKIGRNNLYRSQHPANGSVRSLYANELAEANGIETILNLSDSKNKLEKYIKNYIVGSSYYYNMLYKKGRVYTAGLSVTHRSASYRNQVAAALRFFVKNKGPYLVHCEVGRDRTGLIILLLESLMEVPYNYMVADYALTYRNIQNESPEKARQRAISHIHDDLKYITGQKNVKDWSKVNLARYAALYLKAGGMTDGEIAILRKNLAVSYPDRDVTVVSLEKP